MQIEKRLNCKMPSLKPPVENNEIHNPDDQYLKGRRAGLYARSHSHPQPIRIYQQKSSLRSVNLGRLTGWFHVPFLFLAIRHGSTQQDRSSQIGFVQTGPG